MALTLRRRLRGSRGAELVELALILPLLLLLIGGIVDFAFMFQAFEVVTNAAREGARMAVLPGYNTTDVQGRVTDYITAAGLPATPITTVNSISLPSGVGGTTTNGMSVNVSYTHTFQMLGALIAMVGGGSFANTITLQSTSVMRSEL